MKFLPALILALFAALGVTSCTQILPPSGGTKGGSLLLSEGRPKGGLGRSSITRLELDESKAGVARLLLLGEDAEKVYRLMGIAAEADGEFRKKTGRDFFCLYREPQASCEFQIHLPEGAFRVIREESLLLKAAPEMAQAAEEDAYLLIAPPERPGKIRLQVLDRFGEKMFTALLGKSADDPNRKDGEQIRCSKGGQTGSNGSPSYACFLYLDATLGVIDPIASKPVE